MPTKKTTRAAKGAGMIRQRPDGRWEARYTAGRDPATGKQIQKTVYAKTQGEVRKKLTQALNALDEGTYIEPSKLTVSSWLDIWLAEYVKDTVKPLTYHSYLTQCDYHIKPAMGAVKLSALNTPTIQSFYNKLFRGEIKDKSALSAKTIKNIHGVLHKALKQAVTLGYIKFNPADACTLPRVVKKEIKPLDEADITAFLEAIQGHKYETIYQMTLFTGMRQGEALGLMWDCIDFDGGTIIVNKQLQKSKDKGGGYYLAPLKNDKARKITPAPAVMRILRGQRAK